MEGTLWLWGGEGNLSAVPQGEELSQRLVWKLYLHFHTYFLLRLSGAVMRQEGYDGSCGGAKSFLNHFLSLALPVRWEIFLFSSNRKGNPEGKKAFH